jgi:hypothetical protein
MPRMTWKWALAVAPLAVLACQDPDVGQRCDITWGNVETTPPPNAVSLYPDGADFFESGNVSCENLVCIVSPAQAGSQYDRGDAGGYCSKPCVSDNDCFKSETGLVCRQMVLDPVFLAQLTPELRERYVPALQTSSFCGVPR